MSTTWSNPVSALRIISLAEGVSYLLLLGIAMPLKYWVGLPIAVTIVGSLHGLLFVVLCAALLRTLLRARWPLMRAILVFVSSLIPFAPFWLDRRMRRWESEAAG